MQQPVSEELDFGKTEVTKLFRKIFIPTLLGMIAGVSLTIADGIFVGQGVGSDALAAINIIAPLFMIVTGVALMAGIGCSIAVSLQMAKGKMFGAMMHMSQSIIVFTIFMGVLSLLMVSVSGEVANLLGATERLRPLAVNYLYYIAGGFPFLLLMNVGMFVIRLDGSPRYAMLCSVIPAFINIVLDYVFIFPLGMGLKGAAIATAIGFASGGVMVIAYLLLGARLLKIRFVWRPDLRLLKQMARNIGWHIELGSSALFGELAVAVMMFVGNYVFVRMLGEEGVAAFSVACYCYPLVFMISNAIGQSAQPIISYNHGLGDKSRIRKAVRLTFLTATVFGIVITGVMMIFGRQIISLFLSPGEKAFAIAVEGMPLFALGFLFFLLNIAAISYYQSTERSRVATTVSTLRGVIFPVTTFMLLPTLWGVAGIWLSVGCADLMGLAVFLAIFVYDKKK
ncbi:MAG: MATE family efflux transporter [Bacteroidales bacterium]